MNATDWQALLINQVQEILVIYNPATDYFEFANGALENILGYSPQEFVHTLKVETLVRQEDQAFFQQIFKHQFFGPSLSGYRVELKKKSGELVCVNWTGRLQSDRWFCLIVDMTAAVETEKVLALERRRLETILESVSDLVFQTDATGNCTYINSAARGILGVEPTDVLWQPLKEFVAARENQRDRQKELADFLDDPSSSSDCLQGIRNLEIIHQRGDGRETFLNLNVEPIFDPLTGSLIAKIGTARDDTELSRKKHALIQGSKLAALGEMATGLAHEINNPLAIISILIEKAQDSLSQEETVDKGKLTATLVKMELASSRISRIIKSMRLLAGSSTEDKLEAIPVSHIIDDVLSLCREKFSQAGVILDAEPLQSHEEIECQPGFLAQAIFNLLLNAFDAALAKTRESDSLPPRVRLRVIMHSSGFDLDVEDNGIGVSEDLQDKIFQPFFTTKEVGKGSGLGLSLARGIVERLGGRIFLVSFRKPTLFRMSVPLKKPVLVSSNPSSQTSAEGLNSSGNWLGDLVLR